MTLGESERFCLAVTRRAARNFWPGIRLLPRERRVSMAALYAYMRRTDDIADEPGGMREKRISLAAWRADLERAVRTGSGLSTWPGMPALMAAIDRHGIPVEELLAVCDGADSDLEAREMETFGELGRYCGQVASSVGICCLHIWGYRSEDGRAEALAGDCGIALQLTNILRDVREDALAGRVYLPAEDRARFGVGIDQLRSGEMTQGLRALFAFEAARARRYYESAAALDGLIEAEGRPMFRAVVGVYAALLSAIEKRGYDVLSGRVSVPGWRKAWIALRSAFGWAGVGAGARGAAPLPSSAP